MHMTAEQLITRKVVREILTMIEQIYFSEEYMDYRINYGSNGTRDMVIESIRTRYLR